MGYGVEIGDFFGNQLFLLREGDVTARILPSVGFNCIGFTCRELEVVYPPPDAASLKARPSGFGVPVLFPFPNRIENGLFTFEGMTVQLDVPQAAPHAIHGFVLDKEWEVVDSSASNDDGAWVTGKVRSQDLPEVTRQFPFPFELTATYRLKEEVLILEIKGRNVGKRTMPAGLGTHPYFPLPLTDGGRRGECSLKVPAQKYWPLREDCIPTGASAEVQDKYDFRSTRPIGEETYDDVWTDVVGENGWSACEYEDPSAGAQIRIEADAAFREWVTYAPHDKPVICFEPYTCTTNAVNLDTRGIDGGLVRLSPGESLGGVVRISCLDGTGS